MPGPVHGKAMLWYTGSYDIADPARGSEAGSQCEDPDPVLVGEVTSPVTFQWGPDFERFRVAE